MLLISCGHFTIFTLQVYLMQNTSSQIYRKYKHIDEKVINLNLMHVLNLFKIVYFISF